MALKTKAQKRELRHYLGGLLGESERKNLTQISDNAVGVEYSPLHHFYDGIRSFPLDVELYYKAENFEKGEEDLSFQKKPEIGIKLNKRGKNRRRKKNR